MSTAGRLVTPATIILLAAVTFAISHPWAWLPLLVLTHYAVHTHARRHTPPAETRTTD